MIGEWYLKHSLRCYYWLLIWCLFQIILCICIIKRGFIPGNTLVTEIMAAIVLGYAFFIDMSTQVRWDGSLVYWRTLEAFSIHPLRRSVHIAELASVTSGFRSLNNAPGKPFDSFVLSGAGEQIHIFPSFHRREELEELLRLLHEERPEAFTDPHVLEFMDGNFAEWWPYRRGLR